MDIAAPRVSQPLVGTAPVAAPLGISDRAARAEAARGPERDGLAPAPLSETQRGLIEDKAQRFGELTEGEQAVVDELRALDREVRNHEQAHARVGGQYAGEPSYTYQTGPDGRSYAIGGEVAIDIAPVEGDPEATIVKMEVVKAAALAPAEPSAQDRKVAALADAQRAQAVADLAELRRAVNEPAPDPAYDLVA